MKKNLLKNLEELQFSLAYIYQNQTAFNPFVYLKIQIISGQKLIDLIVN